MDLNEIRKNIDEVDKELFRLFEKRMGLAKCVARSKIETGDCIYKPDREEIVVKKFSENADRDMKVYYEAFIKRVMLISREYQYLVINGGKKAEVNEETVTFKFSCDRWPDNIVTAINDAGAHITGFEKRENQYTIEIEKSLDDEKLAALMLMIQSE